MSPKSLTRSSATVYGTFVLFVAGMGGLLYGIDVGIISAAVLYLDKATNLTLSQTSLIVGAVFGGSMLSSLVAGFFADWFGRKSMMIFSGFLFVSSVGIIVLSQSFVVLFAGRLLQGLSGGVIAVVVPLYLAESLAAKHRGKGAAVFQFALTIGIVLAAVSGLYFTHQAEAAITAAAGNPSLIHAAEEHAWRTMFLSIVYPGLLFFGGSFFLDESPRWLFRKNKKEAALRALTRVSSEEDAILQMQEMEALADAKQTEAASAAGTGSLLRRKYVIPFVLACIILTCNQATGINSILSYLSVILRQAGMTAQHATQGDLAVKVLNALMTIVAIALVDRRGRKFLLTIGTAGVIVALCAAAIIFHNFESKQIDIRDQIQARVINNVLDIQSCTGLGSAATASQPMTLSVLYDAGNGEKIATAICSDPAPLLHIADEQRSAQSPIAPPVANLQIQIKHAFFGPIPSEQTGWLIAACLALFIAAFAVGPGVVVWLALSELMPTRIRSAGMGFALTLNQGTSTLIASVFLPVVGNHGYAPMFAFWAGCTIIYFITAAFFLPETKGRTLEEIEAGFDTAK